MVKIPHYKLISSLSRNKLRDTFHLLKDVRSWGWGCQSLAPNYIFNYSPHKAIRYHIQVADEMVKRGMKFDKTWLLPRYRGQEKGQDLSEDWLSRGEFIHLRASVSLMWNGKLDRDFQPFYEHDQSHYDACIKVLDLTVPTTW